MESDTNNNLRAWVKAKGLAGEALLIAGVTAIAYLAACTYQIAYLTYFKVPLDFLDIRLSTVLLVGLIGLMWVLANIMFFGYFVGKKDLSVSGRVHMLAGVSLFQIFFPILIIFASPIHPVGTVFVVVLIIVACILLIKDFKKEKVPRKDGVDALLYRIEASFGTFFVVFMFLGIFFIFYGAGFGLIKAKIKNSFSVPSTQPDVAIVSIQGDNFIGIVFDQDTNKLTTKVKLITPDQITASTTFETKKFVPTYNYDR